MNTTIEAVKAIIEEAEAMKNAYFFKPPMNASSRRSYEKRHTHETVSWEEGGHQYTAAYEVSCSCSNVYAAGCYTKDGRKTTLTAIRNSLKRLTTMIN